MPQTYVVIKSPPGSRAAMEGKRLAREFAANLILMGAGAALASEEALGGFCGTVYVAQEDLQSEGVKEGELDRVVKIISRAEIIRLAGDTENVLQTF